MPVNNTTSKICFIGGDERQIFAASELSKMLGRDVIVSGEIYFEHFRHSTHGLAYEKNSLKALHASQIVVLPLPASSVEKDVSFLDIIAEMKRCEGMVIAGKFSPYMLDLMDEENVKYADYLNDESFNIKNAFITAEGAVHLAMNSLDTTLREAKCMILGFGRIGKALAQLLLSIGCRPTVFARKSEVRTLAKEMGCFATEALDLRGAEVIFNTVPQRIITNNDLLELPNGRIFIELASAPGGFDPDIAVGCSHTVIDGKGLPGKYAPASAGKAVAESILSILNRINF